MSIKQIINRRASTILVKTRQGDGIYSCDAQAVCKGYFPMPYFNILRCIMDDSCPMCFGEGVVTSFMAYKKRESRCPLCKGTGVYKDRTLKFYSYEEEEW